MNISLFKNQKIHIGFEPNTHVSITAGDVEVKIDSNGNGCYLIAGEEGDSIIELYKENRGETIILAVFEASELAVEIGKPEPA